MPGASPCLIYAGVGARATPFHVLKSMELIGAQLANNWHLRSGYAQGADMAFGRGCEIAGGSFEMYLPWRGFNSAPIDDERFIVPGWPTDLLEIAERSYNKDPLVISGDKPDWSRLIYPVQRLMARNVCQVLGPDLSSCARMVVCWTPGGNSGGGTGQAIRVANLYGIPVFDLARDYDQRALCEFVNAH